MAFKAVQVTDGVNFATAHSIYELTEYQWDGWLIADGSATPPAHSLDDDLVGLLNKPNAAFLLTDPTSQTFQKLKQFFPAWGTAGGGTVSTVATVDAAILDVSLLS